MQEKKFARTGRIFVICAIALILAGGYVLFQQALFSGQSKPELYDYYIIVDEKTEEHLMYVPVTVRVGDELLSENNKRYVVVKVVDDVAYARFAEDIAPSEVNETRGETFL